MKRFEVFGCATDAFALADIVSALKVAGAVRVRSRRAYGMSNQKQVATFSALNFAHAISICRDARRDLDRQSDLPSLLPWEYRP
jgi:hypothetical protein